MQRILLRGKLHQARVTDSELNYEGSCAIDSALLKKVNIMEYERIDIYNINNGERFSTYAIAAKANSCIICINGAAARKAQVGDRIIICSYGRFTELESKCHQPVCIRLDIDNNIIKSS